MSFKFSNKSKKRLDTCHDDLIKIFNEVISISEIDFGVSEGHRSPERQNELFLNGKSKIDGFEKKGKHNYNPSLAIDIYAWVNGKTDYREHNYSYIAGIVRAVSQRLYNSGEISHVIRWGGNWDMDSEIVTDQSFDDLVHFELKKID